MAVQFTDMDALRLAPTFILRVRAAMVQGCVTIGNESSDTVNFHKERVTYTAQVINNPDNFTALFAAAIATDAGVIGAATAAGTVAITGANAEARQAIVTDAQISTGLANVFNAFFRRPA